VITILEALDDEALFAPHFRGESWAAWRSFLRAAFGLPLESADLERFMHHTGRTVPPTAPAREVALICGRRGGKSRILGLIATYLAVFRDYSPRLAPGEAATIAVIAADRRQARGIFRFILGLFRAVPMLEELIEAETAESLSLTNGVVIEIHTASFRVTRGYNLAAVCADEVAFWRSDDVAANPDVEILTALRPGLSSIPNTMLLIASTPYAKRGVLHDAYRRHWGKDGARVLVWRGTTLEMNPTIDPEIVTEAYEADPQAAAAEYGAQFRDDIASFVAREVVDACVVDGRFELPPVSSVRYSAFVDPSGGSADSMTLAVGHREGDRAVIDLVREARSPFSPDDVVREFAETLKAYRVTRVEGDRYAGQWPAERFKAYGVTYEPAARPKSDLYKDALPLLNSGRIELLDLPRLGAQFCGLERRTARGGRDTIDHAPGAHDDLANAVAGVAVMLAAKSRGYDLMRMMGAGSDYDWPVDR
jgi:hypothetical protein